MESCKLSTDLVVDILSRLRVKSLMRFKCVCKFFYDLIKSDHHFMHKHYEISKAKTDCVLLEAGLCHSHYREYYLLYKESEYNGIGCIYLDDVPRTPTPRVQWVKCCRGMLCLISTKNDVLKFDQDDYLIYDILIWNPSIRKVKALPSVIVPYRAPYGAYARNEFGFGISNNMTLKVVMLLEMFSSCAHGGRTFHQSTMVYSQVHGDYWSLRHINSVNPVTSCHNIGGESNDFYLKGRYYWWVGMHYNPYLIWFDMNDEVFGTIELPSNVLISSVSIMNETIALLGYPRLELNCIEIWLMIENDNNTYWHKQASINCVVNRDIDKYLRPIGIWNVDDELLVFLGSYTDWDSKHAKRDVPYFIYLDLVTQERKMLFCISKERKSITMASNPIAGPFQVYIQRNTDIIEEWMYARAYEESLYLP